MEKVQELSPLPPQISFPHLVHHLAEPGVAIRAHDVGRMVAEEKSHALGNLWKVKRKKDMKHNFFSFDLPQISKGMAFFLRHHAPDMCFDSSREHFSLLSVVFARNATLAKRHPQRDARSATLAMRRGARNRDATLAIATRRSQSQRGSRNRNAVLALAIATRCSQLQRGARNRSATRRSQSQRDARNHNATLATKTQNEETVDARGDNDNETNDPDAH